MINDLALASGKPWRTRGNSQRAASTLELLSEVSAIAVIGCGLWLVNALLLGYGSYGWLMGWLM